MVLLNLDNLGNRAGDEILKYVISIRCSLSETPELDEDQKKFAKEILEILVSIDIGDFSMKTDEYYFQDEEETEDTCYDPADDEYEKIKEYDVAPDQPNMVCFGEALVPEQKVLEAVKYYGSKPGVTRFGKRNRPSMSSLTSTYRFIKNSNHLQLLRDIERSGEVKHHRKTSLSIISNELDTKVKDLISKGHVFHDRTIHGLVYQIMKEKDIKIRFKASKSWINNWKKGHKICSRKITKIVSRKNHRNHEELLKTAENFVTSVNSEISNVPLANIYNCDQSGFQYEMNTGRTLAEKGVKTVEVTSISVSATTHSYTVMPLLCADGTLHEKLFVVLQEAGGTFPQKGHWAASNLVVTCGRSHIMTKASMGMFFREMVFHASMPTSLVLIVDSWPCWGSDDVISPLTPAGFLLKKVTIPPGCTGIVQPCDVGFFGGFKNVVKRITEHAKIYYPDHKMHNRDPTLQLLSQVYRQLRSPKLKPWIQYAWSKPGFIVPRPTTFETPAQLLFPQDISTKDCHAVNCTLPVLMECLHCDIQFCFHHFLIDFHSC